MSSNSASPPSIQNSLKVFKEFTDFPHYWNLSKTLPLFSLAYKSAEGSSGSLQA
jgi:hypothetical protein